MPRAASSPIYCACEGGAYCGVSEEGGDDKSVAIASHRGLRQLVEGAMAKLGIQFDGHVRSLGIDQNGAGKQATLVRAGRLRKVRGWARKMLRLKKAGAAVHTVANVGLQPVLIHGAKVLVVRPRHRWAPSSRGAGRV